jgi:hypothetical protein
MKASESISDARRRIEDAITIYRFKSRSALEEYGELAWQWNDSRGAQFGLAHIEPQKDGIERGGELCRDQAALTAEAATQAEAAESDLRFVYGARDAFDDAVLRACNSITAAHELAGRVSSEGAHISSSVSSLRSRISAAAADPGW